ncbi:MAG: hypothetical protein U5K31_04545 [Balneolaceae bacterium]|nr:hypothetical protein [Balneolaceae bacterium]
MMESIENGNWLRKLRLREFPEPELVELQHPVLLCHGYGAIASLVKPSPLYDVALLMRTHGVKAFAPNIVPYAKIETRAQRWVQVIEDLVERTGMSKWNVVAHSMGGLDMRYAISKLEARRHVASLTTVSTPHRGTSLAELTLRTPEAIRDKLAEFLDWMGDQVYPGIKSDSIGSAEQLTRAYVRERFNPEVPDVPDIAYYSYSAGVGKGTTEPINMISRYQNNHIFEEEGINDGMVSVASARWGKHISTGRLSHMEQMNMRIKDDRRMLFDSFWLQVLKVLKSESL